MTNIDKLFVTGTNRAAEFLCFGNIPFNVIFRETQIIFHSILQCAGTIHQNSYPSY